VILNRDHGGFGAKRAVVAFDQDAIGKFQRTVDDKQNFVRSAELDYRLLKKTVVVFVPLLFVRLSLMGIRTGVASGKNLAKRLTMSDSRARAVAWLGMVDLDPENRQPSLHFFLVWKNCEETRSALSAFSYARVPPKT